MAATTAAHRTSRTLTRAPAPRRRRRPVTGFLIQPDNPAAAVYVSGDTVDVAAVERRPARARIAVALLHLGAARFPAFGDTLLSFDAAGAVRAARAMAPATVVAVHAEGWEHFSEGRDDVERAFTAAGLAERSRLAYARAA